MTSLLEKAFRFRYVVFAVLILLAYATSLDVTFYFDDSHSIVDNSALYSISNWYRYWIDPALTSSLPANRSYRPLTFTVYNFLMAAGDGSPAPFHAHKMLLLFGICVLICKIWSRLMPEPRYFGFSLACLWAVHPALSESAVYISASSSLQAAFFYFWAFWNYLRNPRAIWPVALCYAASCFSKEEGITLPAVLVIYEWLLGSGARNRKPIAALSILGIGLFAFIQTRIPTEQSVSRGSVPTLHYFYTQIRAWVHYQLLWLWPHRLNADNVVFGFSKSILEPLVTASLVAQAAVTALLYRYRRQAPILLFGWLWYYLSISPASSVIPLAEPVNERRMLIAYLGYTGIVHWVTWQWAASVDRIRRVIPHLFVAMLLGLTVATFSRVQVWRDDLALWEDVVEKNPGHVRALNNLASVQITHGDYSGALSTIDRCLALSPYLYCKLNQGIALTQLHRYAEAREAYDAVIAMNQGLATPHYYYAMHWLNLREYRRALDQVELALRISGGTHRSSIQLKEQILERMNRQ